MRIGMGCWAIGGDMTWDGTSVGYAGADDDDARAALRAAYDAGVRIFDTAQAYGAGHSERLIGEVLGGAEDAVVVSKIGIGIEEETRRLTGERTDAAYVAEAIEASRARLRRDRVEVMLLHLNELAPEDAAPVFDAMEEARGAGRIGSYGWSTDFPASIEAVRDRGGFEAVEFACNVLEDAPSAIAASDGLMQLVRSPLAMGLLTGKYQSGRTVADGDVRASGSDWNDWFEGTAPNVKHTSRIEALREILTAGGRTLGQGALCWLLARGEGLVPVPGARDAAQAEENAAAMALGPLTVEAVDEIERILDRPPEGPARPR